MQVMSAMGGLPNFLALFIHPNSVKAVAFNPAEAERKPEKTKVRKAARKAAERDPKHQAVVVRLLITALPRFSGSNVQICKQRPVACRSRRWRRRRQA